MAAAAAAAAQQEQYPSQHGSRRPDWRPRQGVLVASLKEHSGAVNRLALSQDQAFFVSASSDATCKVCVLLRVRERVVVVVGVPMIMDGCRKPCKKTFGL